MAFDLLDGDFYVGDPYSAYAWQREHEPVMWDPVNELWGVFRYDDIVDVERRKTVFVSSDTEKGGFRPNLPADQSLIAMDDPGHAERRNLVARRFTPRAVSAWEPAVRAKVDSLVDAVTAKGGGEVITELAAPLPAMMIGHLLGFPEAEWPKLQYWSETTIALGGGPRYANDEGVNAVMEFAMRAFELSEEKRGCPVDDVMSVWVQSDVGGAPMTPEMIVSDCLLLLDGGAETTRTVIARTLLNLSRHPDQWEALRAGADLTVATEEFIRYVTPIHNMCRVANRDTTVGGVDIARGQQLVLSYASANRDPAHFHDPERLDVTRDPNHHIAFGFGTHFCLGAALARLEIRVFFEQLVQKVRSFRIVGEPEEMPNAFVYGLKSAQIEVVPA